MRELLFRGFHPCDGPDTIVVDGEKIKGEWVEGWYCMSVFGRWPLKDTIIPDQEARDGCIEHIEVLPSTVGQYTGLTDKNGKRIFEGDILKTGKYGRDDGNGHNFAGYETFSVEFEDGGYCLKSRWRRFNMRPDLDGEAIGTVFDEEAQHDN